MCERVECELVITLCTLGLALVRLQLRWYWLIRLPTAAARPRTVPAPPVGSLTISVSCSQTARFASLTGETMTLPPIHALSMEIR